MFRADYPLPVLLKLKSKIIFFCQFHIHMNTVVVVQPLRKQKNYNIYNMNKFDNKFNNFNKFNEFDKFYVRCINCN